MFFELGPAAPTDLRMLSAMRVALRGPCRGSNRVFHYVSPLAPGKQIAAAPYQSISFAFTGQ